MNKIETILSQQITDQGISVKQEVRTGKDFKEYIQEYTSEYRTDDYYIYVGEPKVTQGWLLHISIVQSQFEDLIKTVLPIIIKYQVPFKLIKNQSLLIDLNGGKLGHFKIGKALTLFLDNDAVIEPMLKEIIPVTQYYIGPIVFTDFKLSNILYVRYGAFIPIIVKDSFGNNIPLIKDLISGKWIIDDYHTPPKTPIGAGNPFHALTNIIEKPGKNKFIGKKYIPIQLLKRDTKGDVWKGIYFSKYLLPKWCVIKQGRKGMNPDDYGRDTRDRIAWQNKVNKELENEIPVARVIDHFQDEGQAYLITEYVKGAKDIVQSLFAKFKNIPWFLQPASIKHETIDVLLQIVASIKSMHEHGYVHRDITGTNFLESKKTGVRLIDLELVYSLKEQMPTHPFGLGTYGFMSPEQEARSMPTVKEDSYSIGSLMILILSDGLFPNFIIEKDLDAVKDKLAFLIRDERLEQLIMQCIDLNPDNRPSVTTIYSKLINYRTTINTTPIAPEIGSTNSELLDRTIEQAINCLSANTLTQHGVWYSCTENSFGPEVYPKRKTHIFAGIYRGVSGVIWLLSQLKMYGHDISRAQQNIDDSISFLETEIFPILENIDPSLYYGKAGIALAIASALRSGIIVENTHYTEIIDRCFSTDAVSLELIYGITGQGVALLQCEEYLSSVRFRELLDHYISKLLTEQRPDGSWLKADSTQKNEEKSTGFGYGVAGIAYFLLVYGERYKNKKVINAAAKGVDYLVKHAKKLNGKYEWENSNKDKRICTWWCNGAPGIALTFLKAYEVTHKPHYLDIAIKGISQQPPNLIYQDLSQCHGLSGLGEIYLEAYRVTKDVEWQKRADWIANLLIHVKIKRTENESYWLVGYQEFPTADLLIGIGGIIHFLDRFQNINNISNYRYPLLLNN